MQLRNTISEHFRLVEAQKKALKRLKLETVHDLLYHFPARYTTIADTKSVASLSKGDQAVVYGKISKLKTRKSWKSRTPLSEAYIEDATGKIKVMWFNQPYLAKMIKEGAYVQLSGTVTGKEDSLYLANPNIGDGISKQGSDDSLFSGEGGGVLHPVYPETAGITSRWFHHTIKKLFAAGILDELHDPLPEKLLKKYHLPGLRDALIFLHTPEKQKDAEAARKRFAFEEVLYIQLAQGKRRAAFQNKEAFNINVDRKRLQKFIDRFPFKPTGAQTDAIESVLSDFERGYPMTRLLEGDVGSGKTAVAASTVYAVTTTPPKDRSFGTLQTAYMVPTEILAKQHFESFIEFFNHMPINIGLITSSGCKKFPSKVDPTKATDISRAQLLKWIKGGEISILIGTHSLIQDKVQFQNLAYIIIDEQHRFGTMQRKTLTRKDTIIPHLLSMTATPIPRTLALTIYGDLDLTVLDQMPLGRKPIITKVIAPDDRSACYEDVRKELQAGRQAYVICPRIDEADPTKLMAIIAKSVKEEAKRLKDHVFPEYEIGILHGKMKPAEKEEVMNQFESGEIDILVATSVVEVGVNVPNATVIVIEGAERFGLAQLHQLRGRVIRSNHQAYCYVFSESKSKHTDARLKALTTAANGFELAEEDLKLRGPGELTGRNQSGISDVGMEAIRNLKMVEAARTEATSLLASDPDLKKTPLIMDRVERTEKNLHFE